MAESGSPASVSIVDSHQHVWDLSVRAQPFLETSDALAPLRRTVSIGELVPVARAVGVTATVIVQTVTERGETPELMALASAEPLVVAVVGWTDLTSPAVADALAELRAMPGGRHLAGIRHPLLTEPRADWIVTPEVRRGLAAVAAAGLTFDLVLAPHQLPTAVEAAAQVPELMFVLDHLGNVEPAAVVDAEWASAFSALATLPNATCKLSGMLSEPAPVYLADRYGEASVAHLRPYFDLALDRFGPDRLMFGSDWPLCTLSSTYGQVVAAAMTLTSELAEPERAAIMGGTAQSVYRIGDRCA